jgi:hypothetical protein
MDCVEKGFRKRVANSGSGFLSDGFRSGDVLPPVSSFWSSSSVVVDDVFSLAYRSRYPPIPLVDIELTFLKLWKGNPGLSEGMNNSSHFGSLRAWSSSGRNDWFVNLLV